MGDSCAIPKGRVWKSRCVCRPLLYSNHKKTEYLYYVLLLYTWEQFTQPAQYPTASEGTAGHRVLRGLKFNS